MAVLKEICKFLDNYLEVNEVTDNCLNGLDIKGKSEVRKVIFAVDASLIGFKKAVSKNADLIVVHHGRFGALKSRVSYDWPKEKFEVLKENHVSLYSAHIPLD